MHFWQIWPNVLALYLFSRDDSEFYRTMKWTGIIFTVLLIYSASFGCIFFLTPLIPFVFFQPRLGRKLMDQMIWLWQLYAVVSLLWHVLHEMRAIIHQWPMAMCLSDKAWMGSLSGISFNLVAKKSSVCIFILDGFLLVLRFPPALMLTAMI